MKNLKKVLALVVALTMVLGTVAFAGYTDVAEDAAEYTAVSTLSSLDILTGFEDGSFQPDGDITRAQFAAVVCRALGASVSGNAVTGFSDVASDHWASGYIAYVAGQKIVNGMGDGTFAPEANVTFEQAVKMLVVALGFEPMAAQKGGYPTGYMVIANTYEMTKGINVADQTAPASRGVVAQLTYNALDIPMMEQTGFGSQTEYTIQDGTNNKAYKTLLTGLDVAKLDGVIVKSARYGDLDKNAIEYDITESYDNADYEDRNGDPKTGVSLTLADGVVADDYFGVASTIYVKEVTSSKKEVIAIMPGVDSEIVTVALEDIDEANTDDEVITYYPSASSTKTSRYKLDKDNATFYYNYAEVTVDDKMAAIINKSSDTQGSGEVEIMLIENDGDSSYDMVIAKEYFYDIVDEVEIEKDRFSVKSSPSAFSFDFEDADSNVSITNKDGDEVALADFKAGDVIAYLSDNNSTNKDSYKWIEIINLGESSVTGTVDETTEDSIFIDGTEYNVVSGDDVVLGDEGVFYLTQTGKIFYVDTSSKIANYGYILNAKKASSGFTDAYQVKLLTKDDGIKIYTVKDNFKFNGEAYAEDDSTPWVNFGDKDAVVDSGVTVTPAVNFKSTPEKRLVTYKLDSNGLIREINNEDSYSPNAFNVKTLTEEVEYKADIQKLGKYLEEDVVIFNIDANRDTNVKVLGIEALIDEAIYDCYLVQNANDEYDCVILVNGECNYDGSEDPDNPILSEEQYGYILNAKKASSGFTDAYQVKMLTKDDGIKIYTVRDNFKFNGYAYAEDDSTPWVTFGDRDALVDSDGDVVTPAVNFKSTPEKRLVTYKLDSNGLIGEINNEDSDSANAFDVQSLIEEGKYNADSQTLGKVLEDDVVIFNIDANSDKSVKVIGITSLIDETKYDYYLVKNANDEYDCVILVDAGSLVDYTQRVAIAQSVTTIMLDDRATVAKKVYYYTAGNSDIASIIIADDEDISTPEGGSYYDDVVPGAFFMFTDDGEGTASAYTEGNNGDNGIIGGYIESWKNRSGKKVISANVVDAYGKGLAEGNQEITIGSGINGYTFVNRTASKLSITVGDWAASTVDVKNAEKEEVTYFLAFTVDGDIVDFITFSTRKAEGAHNNPLTPEA